MTSPTRTGPTQDEIRRQNLGALLRQVHVRGALSRAELTSFLGLSRSTIGGLTADLSAAGLVSEEQPSDRGRGGRPSLVVRPQTRVFAYAMSIGVDRISAARVGLGGEILDRRETARGRGDTGLAEVVPPLSAMVRQLRDAAPPDGVCVGTGAAIAGTVRRGGSVAPLGPSAGESVARALTEALDLRQPVAVGNRADLAALAEHTRGCAVDADNVVYLHGDAGIGGGIIAGGRLVVGRGGHGGEVGHMIVNPNGRLCGCGSTGCWETEVGEHALLRAAEMEGTGPGGFLAVLDAAGWGDARARSALRRVGGWLGFGVANLVNIFNPEVVAFGGTLRGVYLAATAQVRASIDRYALPACRQHLRLRVSELADDAPLIGAAELAFQRLLADPLAVPD